MMRAWASGRQRRFFKDLSELAKEGGQGSDGRRGRIDFIDALRGYVILMMLQGHTLTLTLADEVKETGGWVYAVWHYMTGLTAPAFFFTSGLIFSYLLVRDDDAVHVQSRLRKGVKRGLWLILLGFVLQLNLRALWEFVFVGSDYVWWRFLLRTTVLQAIGMSLLILVGVFSLCRRLGWSFSWIAGGLGAVAFLLGPLSFYLPAGEGWDRLWTVFVVRKQAYFPVLQWVGYPLFGAVFGVLTRRFAWYESGRFIVGMIVGGLLLTHVGAYVAYLLAGQLAPLFGYELEVWNAANGGTFYRLGEVFVLVAVMAWFVEKVGDGRLGSQWLPYLLRCGQETLTIFFLHVLLLYGGLFGFGLGRAPLQQCVCHCLEPFPAILLAVVVVLSFGFLAQWLPKLRVRFRWLDLLK